MDLTGTMEEKNNELFIGGIGVKTLKEKYGTPLQIIDQKALKEKISCFKDNFQVDGLDCRVVYASKAFLNKYMVQLVKSLGLHIDAVSGGELYTILASGMPAERIYFHGNNKLASEIREALEAGVGTYVVDSIADYHHLREVAVEAGQRIRLLLRVNPGIAAETHQYIQTTTEDSKFGMSMTDSRIEGLIQNMLADPQVDLAGFHCHIGSQVLKENFFFEEAESVISFAKKMSENYGMKVQELNLGGGFGVYYAEGDQPFDYASFLTDYAKYIKEEAAKQGLSELQVMSIEPGRSLINASGSTLYTVGQVKVTKAGLPFIFVDGGMSDNIRPALYQAEYEAVLANRLKDPVQATYRVGGKLCESGDVLLKAAALPKAEAGDLLLMPNTGAYTYSMSSNYNRMGRPAVVFLEDAKDRLAVKRETYADMMRNDLSYEMDE
ncbi:diaminopimelate decarboxylase [Aerococcus sp. UMB7834]|uniref:diaminopimelate decarboxylase n=1 Tax=Aerococcus sp. UMB7834 TaxID=3046342 RepID=UPI00254EAF25|nr:diaminopimelate decarboxylase [Aerococcus sp. UMB7834]MDK6805240.1 diaminopimelate decarboxylase [Aerococcus sp. UMB7834]